MDTYKMQCTGIPSRVTRRSNTPNAAVFLVVSYHRHEINSSWLGLDPTLYVHHYFMLFKTQDCARLIFLLCDHLSRKLTPTCQLVNPRLNRSFVEAQAFYRASLRDLIFFLVPLSALRKLSFS